MLVELTTSARLRFREARFFCSEYMSEREIEQVNSNVLEALVFLSRHPRAGACEELIFTGKTRYRRWIVGNLKIIYYIERDTLWVTDIYDSRQDPRLMRG